MPSTLRWLNLLFRDAENVEAIYNYLKHGTPPPAKRRKLTPEVLAKFELDHDNIVFKPEGLTYIAPAEIQGVLRLEYDQLNKTAGLGCEQLYKVFADDYYGISRQQVCEFLNKQPGHQLTRPYKKAVNKPVLAKKVNERWQCDLVELERFAPYNSGYVYLLNVVDVFTRFLWSVPLKQKEAALVRDALERIAAENGYPRVLQSDQGTEFKAEVDDWCKEHNIKHSRSKSYSPRGNGLIEGTNKILREKLHDALVRHQTRRYIDYLDDCVESWNRTTHGGQDHPPMYLYHSASEDIPEEQRAAIEKQELRAREAVKRNKAKEFQVGDIVRVSIAATTSAARKEIKSLKTTKNIVVKFSPELYRIKSIVKPDNDNYERGLQKLQYTLETLQGRPLHTERRLNDPANRQRRPARFFANELLAVDDSDLDKQNLPPSLTDKLNIGLGTQTRVPEPPRPRAPRQPRAAAAPAEPRRSTRAGRGRNRHMETIYEQNYDGLID